MGQGISAIGTGQVVEARETLLIATIANGNVHQPALVHLVVVHWVDPAHQKGPDFASHIALYVGITGKRSCQDSVSSTKYLNYLTTEI